MTNAQSDRSMATLAGGCFWCLEAVFENVIGVDRVVSGYMGGATVNPSYEQVCTGRTGHAEVVQISFDPLVISFSELLEIFLRSMTPRPKTGRVTMLARSIARLSFSMMVISKRSLRPKFMNSKRLASGQQSS